jgi:hypothetical protein
MGRGIVTKGMPPSHNTVWSPAEVDEKTFEDNWARAFGRTEPNKDLKSEFEKDEEKVRHRVKQRNDMGE